MWKWPTAAEAVPACLSAPQILPVCSRQDYQNPEQMRAGALEQRSVKTCDTSILKH